LFAVQNHRGTAIQGRRGIDQHAERCQTVPLSGLEGSTHERIAISVETSKLFVLWPELLPQIHIRLRQ
jgi:hypothetical protein